MNLYKLHTNDESLIGHDYLTDTIEAKILADEIMNSEHYNYDVADDIINFAMEHGRDEIIEDAILSLEVSGALLMVFYAETVIEGRWYEAEQFIEDDAGALDDYRDSFDIEDE